MATKKRKPDPALIERLVREPAAFDFFQAVHLLEQQAAVRTRGKKPVGFDHPPSEVAVRFRSAPSLAFPVHPIVEVKDVTEEGGAGYEVLVSFLGLVGPAGTLPRHYTESLLERLHIKDAALRDFLDGLQHRTTALFFRAWRKYRMPAAYTHTRRERGDLDPILGALASLVGRGTRQRSEPFGANEMARVHHAGHFADRRRSAEGLRAMLKGLLRCEVQVDQFVGEWVELDRAAQSRLGDGPGPGMRARLGDESVLGARVWSVDARVRVVAGPMDRERFRELWPGSPKLVFLQGLVRAYLGPLLDCSFVWRLSESAPAAVGLGSDQRLGRDCWLGWSRIERADMQVSSPPGTMAAFAGS
jgi:type VI secretion system protein ImpH